MEDKKKLKIVFIIKVIVCVAGIIVGICLWNLNPGLNHWDMNEYGADFYTDIYSMTEDASNNVHYLSQNISYISSCFMIIISAFALVCSIGSYFKGLTLIKINESLSAKPTVAKAKHLYTFQLQAKRHQQQMVVGSASAAQEIRQ